MKLKKMKRLNLKSIIRGVILSVITAPVALAVEIIVLAVTVPAGILGLAVILCGLFCILLSSILIPKKSVISGFFIGFGVFFFAMGTEALKFSIFLFKKSFDWFKNFWLGK